MLEILELILCSTVHSFHRFEDAIEVLKAFERKDTQMKAMAATNLSFIYFLEGERSDESQGKERKEGEGEGKGKGREGHLDFLCFILIPCNIRKMKE